MKKYLAASATLAIGISVGVVQASAACDPATRAIQYLASSQVADGSIDENINETADFVLGAASDGIDPGTLSSPAAKTPFDFFLADLAGPRKSVQDANVLGKLIQAVVAGHRNPRNFGGVDLLDTLRHGTTVGSNPQPFYDGATGTFLDALSSGQNQAFTQANALLGLAAAADPTVKVPGKAVTRLKSLRSTSGPARGAWSSFGTFDTNDTSMALLALVASHDTPATDPAVFSDAFGFLRTQQDPKSGGFTFSTDFGSASDPDSDSFVVQALVATGEDPAGAAWTNTAGNATTDITTFQDPVSGGFRFAAGGKVQAFATSQAVLGLRRAALPITGDYTAGASLPAADCPAATGGSVRAATTGAPGLPRSGRPATASSPKLAIEPKAVIVAAIVGMAIAPGLRRRRRLRR